MRARDEDLHPAARAAKTAWGALPHVLMGLLAATMAGAAVWTAHRASIAGDAAGRRYWLYAALVSIVLLGLVLLVWMLAAFARLRRRLRGLKRQEDAPHFSLWALGGRRYRLREEDLPQEWIIVKDEDRGPEGDDSDADGADDSDADGPPPDEDPPGGPRWRDE
jgi:hypothetical protein